MLELGDWYFEPRARRQDHRSFDEVGQLADVARPSPSLHGLERLVRDHLDAPPHPLGESIHEVAHELRDVFRALAQRWQVEREDVQPIVAVVAEAVVVDYSEEIAVARRDHTNVHLDGPRAAETLEFLLLEDPQKLRLELEGNVADLVEEERPAVRHLEAAELLSDRPGERAALVTEELALEEARRDRCAVYLDERPITTVAQIMDGASHQFLAGAGLAEDEHGRVRRCNRLDLPEHVMQRRALTHDVLEVVRRRYLLNVRDSPRRVPDAPDLVRRSRYVHGLLRI